MFLGEAVLLTLGPWREGIFSSSLIADGLEFTGMFRFGRSERLRWARVWKRSRGRLMCLSRCRA